MRHSSTTSKVGLVGTGWGNQLSGAGQRDVLQCYNGNFLSIQMVGKVSRVHNQVREQRSKNPSSKPGRPKGEIYEELEPSQKAFMTSNGSTHFAIVGSNTLSNPYKTNA
jgi:hypothetical protein